MKIPTECFRRQIWRSGKQQTSSSHITIPPWRHHNSCFIVMCHWMLIHLPCAQTSKGLKNWVFYEFEPRGIVLTLGWIFKIELSVKVQPRQLRPVQTACYCAILSKASFCMAKQSHSSQSEVFWILDNLSKVKPDTEIFVTTLHCVCTNIIFSFQHFLDHFESKSLLTGNINCWLENGPDQKTATSRPGHPLQYWPPTAIL